MAGGFTSPSILFLSTWDGPERSFCATVFRQLRARGYTRFVEPCAGAFAMPLVAQNAGWDPGQMEASDVGLFSAIVGTTLDPDGDWDRLGIQLDGEPVEIAGTSSNERGANLLYVQLLTRTEARPDIDYWRAMVTDLHERRDEHVAALTSQLERMAARIGGLRYQPLDLWDHIEQVADDPATVVSINPPTYHLGFERFFDTKGRLTWAEPDYSAFDPNPGNARLVALMRDAKALLVAQQQREPGGCSHERPIFARHLSFGQYVYLHSNRPDEIFQITGGPRVAPRNPAGTEPFDTRVIPPDYEITAKSTLQLVEVRAAVADYYRELWMHRLAAAPGGSNVLVLVDGYAAGVIGLSIDSMANPYGAEARWMRHLILRFAFGAPHDTLRLTRLATMAALRKSTVDVIARPSSTLLLASSKGLVTVEYTRHPEAKGLRGLMKQVDKTDHPDGFRLVYAADWDTDSRPVLQRFLEKEAAWRKTRDRQLQEATT